MSVSRNSIYNLAGALVPLAVTLITLPTYIGLIGEERFGVLSIAWLLLGYFGLFDLGLGRATAQRIASLRAAEPSERAETFWTAMTLNAGFGVFGGILLWPVAYVFFTQYFQVDELVRQEILLAIPWLIAAVPIATISGVLTGSLQGREQFLALNITSVLGVVMLQVLPLFTAMFFGPALQWVLPTAILARLLTLFLLFLQAKSHLSLYGSPSINRELIKPLLRFGGWVSISSIISPLMAALDRFIIGALVGAKYVTYYTVPFNLARRITVFPTSLASALFPRMSAVNDTESNRLSIKAIRIVVATVTPVIIGGLLLIRPFFSWWLGPAFATAAVPAGQILLIGVWANSFARIPYAQLQATGRPDLVAKIHLAELPPYLIMLFVGLEQWGIVGAAIAWSVRVAADAILLLAMSGLMVRTFRELVMPMLMVIITVLIAMNSNTLNLMKSLLCVGIFLCSVTWALYNLKEQLNALILRSRWKG